MLSLLQILFWSFCLPRGHLSSVVYFKGLFPSYPVQKWLTPQPEPAAPSSLNNFISTPSVKKPDQVMNDSPMPASKEIVEKRSTFLLASRRNARFEWKHLIVIIWESYFI